MLKRLAGIALLCASVLLPLLTTAQLNAQQNNYDYRQPAPNTVLGRVGGGGFGPVEDIPFSRLCALIGCAGGSGNITLGVTPIGGPGPVVGDCLSIAPGPVVGQLGCTGGGSGGLLITRAQIPVTNTNSATSLILTGYATAGDRGSGAPYTCSGQTSASVGAIQDGAGTWCAFDIARVASMDGFQDGWFGAKADGATDDTAAMQASYDATFNAGLGNAFCTVSAAGRITSYPLYYDPPGSMRGGAAWSPPFIFAPSGGYVPGSIITGFNGSLYSNNGSTSAWSDPTSPDSTGVGLDLAWQIVSSTSSVTYSPSWSQAPEPNGIVVASFKGSGAIGTPVTIGYVQAQTTPNSFATTISAPAGSLIIVAIADSAGAGVTTVTDNATGGSNTYVNAVSIDNATLGGIYIFYSTTGHALPASGSAISVSGSSPTIYQATVLSVANASSGLDKTALVDNTSNPSTNPSVATGVLAQTNEIVFGAIVSAPRMSQNFVESAGFTFTTPNKWTLAAWNAGTTYNAGDHIIFEGIPWSSLQNGNTGNNPQNDLGPNFLPVWWQPITLTPSRNAFSDGAYLHGSPFYGPGSFKHGCSIKPTFNNSAGLIMAPGNGIELRDIEVEGPTGATRCGNPTTGIGIAEFGVGGGSNRVKYTNVTAQNFFYNIAFGLASIQNPNGGAGLGAENHVYTPGTGNGCYGIFITGTQSFINSITDATLTDDNTEVYTPATVGVRITGGNYSHENGPFAASKFAMSNVVSAGITPNVGYSFTATLATPSDPYMTKNCSNTPINSSNLPTFPDARCLTNVYNTFMLDLRSAGYGIVPFVMTSWNRNTSAATFWTLYSWFTAYGGQCCGSGLTTAIGAATNVWAAEMTRKFVGENLNVDSIHIEDAAPFQLVDTNSQFAPGSPTTLRHIIFNNDYTNCNAYTPGNAATEASCFAQQEFPFINVGQGDLILENIISTVIGPIGGEQNMIDFPPAAGVFTPHLTVRGWQWGQFNFRIPPFSTVSSSFNGNSQGNFSGNYQTYGSAAFGMGDFEMAPMTGFTQASNTNITGGGASQWTENAWLTRTQGLGRSPFYGTRPAPWTNPCISPLELVKATTYLPAIYLDANNLWQVNYALLSSGQQYKVCDWNLTPTAWNSGANYFPGSLVTNAGTIYVNMAGDANVLANRNETPGTPQTFTASISGTTMTVTAVTGSVLLHAPITSGAAAGTTIVQQLTGTAGSTGTYQVEPSQTVASSTLTATYWASLGATFHFGAVSNHFAGYSYGQDITTTNNPGLGWSVTNNSPYVAITGGRNGLYFPGWVMGLTGTQGGCGPQQNFAVRGVHGLLGYLDTFLLDSDVNGNVVPAFGAALCSNTVIKQAPYSVTNLN